jgi:putative transcriptional regulator
MTNPWRKYARGDLMIRNNLKSIRHSHEMNQKEFAIYLGIRYEQYNRYERQDRQPNLEVALRMSEKLGVTVNDIVYLVDESDSL